MPLLIPLCPIVSRAEHFAISGGGCQFAPEIKQGKSVVGFRPLPNCQNHQPMSLYECHSRVLAVSFLPASVI